MITISDSKATNDEQDRLPCGGQLSDQMFYFEINFLLYVLIFLEIAFIAAWGLHNNISANDFITESPKSCHAGSTPCPIGPSL